MPKTDNSIGNVEFSNHSLFSFLTVPFRAAVVDVSFVGDCFIFGTRVHGVVKVVGWQLAFMLVDRQNIFEQSHTFSILEQSLPIFRHYQIMLLVDDAVVLPQRNFGVEHSSNFEVIL